MKRTRLLSILSLISLLSFSELAFSQDTLTIGLGTSSSSTRGPFQRSDTNSSSVYSRFVMLYTATELAAAGILPGQEISELQWETGNSNVIIGSGNATLDIFMKNSSNTKLGADTTWANYTAGSSQVLSTTFNTTNNFPGVSREWVPFVLTTPFVYTGGALEVAVDWDCSQVTTPIFSGNGSITWRWSSTSPDTLVVYRVSGSAPPTDLTRYQTGRAGIRMVYDTPASACVAPAGLNVSSLTPTTANLDWMASANSTAYFWKVVPAGSGVSAAAVDSGATPTTTASATGLSPITSYEFYVQSICGLTDSSNFAGPVSFLTPPLATDTITIGMGTSSSSTRGPLQRSDTNSSTVFSRWHQIYTAAELTNAGLVNGTVLTGLNWELASSNVIIGSGNANVKIYIKNSSATAAVSDTWVNLTNGSTLVHDVDYNTTNNFPGANGWMPFDFSNSFTYTGGALEISVDWDNSQLTTPAFSGDGSLKWRWESTAPDNLVVKKTSSSAPSSTLSDLKNERANIQMVFATMPVGIAELDESVSLNISPNPTSGLTNLNIDLSEPAVVEVSIYSIDGKIIESSNYNIANQFNKAIDLSAYENGVYFIKVSVNNQQTIEKVVLAK